MMHRELATCDGSELQFLTAQCRKEELNRLVIQLLENGYFTARTFCHLEEGEGILSRGVRKRANNG